MILFIVSPVGKAIVCALKAWKEKKIAFLSMFQPSKELHGKQKNKQPYLSVFLIKIGY
jgi:hypothetical protein